eukprot:TRINITY_DN2059_c0_g1_i4.p2 TRINITY_DN2059_c0_g1~~TRINITY_DN2059_c0_g1_i4.p2  ORF type:complete len:101 (-),score=17.03 TRINITY_DN2059_c0_g1_i4:112-414(-)
MRVVCAHHLSGRRCDSERKSSRLSVLMAELVMPFEAEWALEEATPLLAEHINAINLPFVALSSDGICCGRRSATAADVRRTRGRAVTCNIAVHGAGLTLC